VLGVDVVDETSAMVRFSDANECVRAAATYHNTLFNERPLLFAVPTEAHLQMVQSAPAARPQTGHRVFIFGLPFSFNWKDLKNLVEPFGSCFVDIKTDQTGRSRGFAVVRFDNYDDAMACINGLNNTELERRILNVRMDKDAA
jgi:RNA recognition motif-containing protein